ncbi:MAG: pyridoxal phosphate-dependent aminotransferase [Saprospiraceae bacterium]|nr:pyridoxal phosphate-dependent aminotransferase [Saprospiraceae bacterium]
MFRIAGRIAQMEESATLRMAQRARQMRQSGADVINLSLGEPDFDTPEFIKEAAIKSMRAGATKYTPVAGTQELREAIRDKFLRDNNISYSVDELMVSCGAKQCFANLCFALLEEGDEAVMLAPYWVSYYEIVKLAGAQPVVVQSAVENNFKPNLEELRKALSSRTKLFVFSTPCNPTGTVFSEGDLRGMAELFAEFPDVLVISDEIYEYIQFGTKHFSIASLPGMKERCATINGFSKGFAMTGWRLGYMGAPKPIIDACVKIQGQFTSGAASFSQEAATLALRSDLTETFKMRDAYARRRDHLLAQLKNIPGFRLNQPQGAFYILPEVSDYFGKRHKDLLIKDAEDFAQFLLAEAHVAVVNGIAFGAPQCIRISYSISEARITEAVERIRRALALLH